MYRIAASTWFGTTAGTATRLESTRKAATAEPETPAPADAGMPEQLHPEASSAARATCARLIKKVYEAAPLVCPHRSGEMRFLSVIEHILRHPGLWDPRPPSKAPPEDDDWPVNGQMPLTYEPLPSTA